MLLANGCKMKQFDREGGERGRFEVVISCLCFQREREVLLQQGIC